MNNVFDFNISLSTEGCVAAQLRATTSVKTPDALQLVAAIGAGCQTFLTNDRRLPLVPGLEIRQLSAYVA